MKGTSTEKDHDGISGTIDAILPKRLYRVRLEDGKTIQAGLSPTMQHGTVRLMMGDRVSLQVSRFDPNRGHICRRV